MNLPMATVMMMIFLIARSVNHLAKAQRSLQHMAISESAYWSLTETILQAEAEHEPPRGHLTPDSGAGHRVSTGSASPTMASR